MLFRSESVRSRVCNLSELSPSISIPDLTEALERAFTAACGLPERLRVADLDPARLAAL